MGIEMPPRRLIASLISSLAMAAACGGCGSRPTESPQPGGSPRVKVAYLGLSCEAAMFVAQEKGFFKDEGLDVEFVKTDWDGLRDGLGLGKFDANYTLIMYLLKPIEQGLDVKITGGVHSGCLRLQVGAKSAAKSVTDLKGKTVGIPAMGSPPFLFVSRAMAAQGMDPTRDVKWAVVAPEVMKLSLESGQVEAVANSEPLGSILAAQGDVRTIADQAVDGPYREEYCCATVVSGKLAARSPATAAKVTRAMLKGARWVGENPSAAAHLSVEKRYTAASAEVNAQAIAKLKYMPAVAKCRESVLQAAKDMKTAGLLNPSTDPSELAKRAWVDLDGVTDDWLRGLSVESVAGGGKPPTLSGPELVALFAREKDFVFCDGCGLTSDPDLCGR